MKIGIIVADFNKEITSRMEKKALEIAKKLKADVIEKVHVPGSFEIPLMVKKLFRNKKIDGIAALGAVIQGDTWHDVIVAENASRKIMDLSLECNKPVGLGLIGPRVTWEQAQKRAEEYAERAVKTTVEMVIKLKG